MQILCHFLLHSNSRLFQLFAYMHFFVLHNPTGLGVSKFCVGLFDAGLETKIEALRSDCIVLGKKF